MKVCIVNCFETYNIRSRIVGEFFQSRGDEVIFLESDFFHMKKIYKSNIDLDENTIRLHVPSYKKNLSIRRMYSHKQFSLQVAKFLSEHEFDLIYGLIPPNSILESILNNRNRAKTVADIIDLWPESFPITEENIFMKYFIKKRNENLALFDKVISECNLFKNKINIENKLDIHTIYFCGGKNSFSQHINKKDELNLAYIGSINNIIDIDLISQLINSLSKNITVNIHVIGTGEKKDEFLSRMKDASANVFFYGTVYDDNKKKIILEKCDFGINLMKQSVMVGVTMKSIEYYRFSLPIINNIQEDTWGFVDERNIGVNINRENIENGMKEILKLKNNINFQSENVKKLYLDHFSREVFFENMELVMSNL